MPSKEFLGRWLSILILLVGGNCGEAMELPDTVDSIRDGIVGVGTVPQGTFKVAQRPMTQFRGTGFVIRDGFLVVTNAHVLPDKDNAIGQALAVFVGRGKNVSGREALVYRVDKQHDLAILRISGNPLKSLVLDSITPVREGQSIAFTGFPLGPILGLYPATNVGIVSSITPIVIPAENDRRLTPEIIERLRSPYDVYQLDAVAYPGNSGSPVYDPSTGKVLGVVNSVFVKETKESILEKPSGITYAVPIRYVELLLSKE